MSVVIRMGGGACTREQLDDILHFYLDGPFEDEEQEYIFYRAASNVIRANKEHHPDIISRFYGQYMRIADKFIDRGDY